LEVGELKEEVGKTSGKRSVCFCIDIYDCSYLACEQRRGSSISPGRSEEGVPARLWRTRVM
jgi:hypothetical protein